MSKVSEHETVPITVIKHLPLGLFIELENGQHGIVRARETSWDREQVDHWRDHFPVGWHGLATPITARKGQFREFSLRTAESDPWDTFSDDADPTETIEGIVAGVVSYGAFIEIGESLTGLLHKSELPGTVKSSPLDLFWPGDHVQVRVVKVDEAARKISLGLPYIHDPDENGSSNTIQVRHSTRLDGESVLDAFSQTGQNPTHILLVEDEPTQAMAVSNWLNKIGQRVDIVPSAEKALEYLESSTPDLALIDVCLPGMQGNELAMKISETWPQVRLVLTTDWARADSMMEEMDSLQEKRVELLIKPLMPADLVWILRQEAPAEANATIEISEIKPVGQVLPDAPTFKSNSSVASLLNRCRKYLGFDGAALFALDPIQRTVSIAHNTGEIYCHKTSTNMLIFSPVRDVAEGEKAVISSQITEADRNKFKYLLEFCPEISSCLAVHVPANLQMDYALFLFHKRPKSIPPEHKIYADATALALGTILEQEFFKEKSAHIQRTTLIGHLTRTMVHEINNLIGPLSVHVDNLKANLEKIERDPSPSVSKETLDRLVNGETREIQTNVRRIINNTRMFGRIVAQAKNSVLRLDEIISETIGLLREISDKAKVRVFFTPPEQLIIIRNQAAALEQVLLNIMLNAVQQIDEYRQSTGGWIHIRVEMFVQGLSENSCRICIEDNGPGIHANLWEKIFEAGFTTRPEGSGIGLYLSRNLVHDLGGNLYVQESYILSGTTFALEIPCSL